MQIKRMDGEEITGTVTPSNIVDSVKNNVVYSDEAKGNSVFDMLAPINDDYTALSVFKKVNVKAANDTYGRASIKYSNSEINLFFPITTADVIV